MSAVNRRVELVFEVPWTHPSWTLLDEDNMPDNSVQDEGSRVVVSWLRHGLPARGRDVLVRRNPALRWDEEHPKVGVDPDVCVLEPAPSVAAEALPSICTWKPGIRPPVIAFENVSEGTAAKDYGEGPAKYASSGTRELWVFDPQRLGPRSNGGPWLLQVWERGRTGDFRRTYAGDGPVYSEVLGAWLRASDDGMTLRASDDEEGTALWPTEEEDAWQQRSRADQERVRADTERVRAEAERERADTERQRADTERERADAERERADAAEARLAALEAMLKKG